MVLQRGRRWRCPIVDTWWQTETGGILITPLPGATDLKPGSATRPFFGVSRKLVDGEGKVLDGATDGNLCIIDSWPGQMRTVYGDHERFVQTYFSTYKGKYFTGDGCRRDEDGYYWITGRVDDVINVSGHRMGTAEVESALVSHDKVSEAAVVGYPHDIKGQGIYCYVTLMAGDVRKGFARRAAQGAGRPCAQPRDRPDRDARQDPVRAGPAEDPLGQDHAPHPAQDRRGRFRRARRHLDAGRSGVVDDLIANRQNKKGARKLDPFIKVVDEVHGFKYFDQRDLLGFVDGTENPVDQAAFDAAFIGDEDPDFAGGSYVIVQKYLHDLRRWTKVPVHDQEDFIGREKLSDIEQDDSVKKPYAHNVLTNITDDDGNQLQIVRDNMPFGAIGSAEFGTYFIGYARDPARTERMLDNMFIGDPPGTYDRLLDFSTAVTGCLFFIPTVDFLDGVEPDSGLSDSSDGSLGIGSLKT
jgi:hypothetical protein